MKYSKAIGWLSLIVILGIGVSFRAARSVDTRAHNEVNRRLQRAGNLDNRLKQYVLAARFGMLRRYDPVVQAATELQHEVGGLSEALRGSVGRSPSIDASLLDVQSTLAHQLGELERFKGEAAILKNSLTYLPVALEEFEAALRSQPDSDALTTRADRLVRLALTFNVLGSPTMARDLRRQLSEAEALSVDLPEELAFDWNLLLRHARQVVDQHEAIRPTIDTLLEPDFQRRLEAVQAAYVERYVDQVRVASQAQVGMAVLVGLLVLLFGRVALDLRALYATLEKRVERRTAELAAKQQELELASDGMHRILDNVGQGLFTVELDGHTGAARSAIVDRWLGTPAATERVWEWFARHDEDVAAWLELAWDDLAEGIMPAEVVLQQLPSRMTVGELCLRLQVRPVGGDDGVARVLFVISDITAEVERNRLEAAQQETLRMFQRLSSDRAGFLEFMDEGTRLVSMLQDRPPAAQARRVTHTIKGNCSIFGLLTLVELCHEVEARMVDEGGTIEEEEVERITSAWMASTQRLQPFLDRSGDVVVDRQDLDALRAALEVGTPPEQVLHLVERWTLEPIRNRFERVADQAQRIAARLGKEVRVEIDDGGLRLEPGRWAPFWAAFVHVLRNALDHGLEDGEQRCARGKAEVGRLRLVSRRVGEELEIAIEDDGRGIDWDALAARARELGLPFDSREALVNTLFEDGVSSRQVATHDSGRGIGMGAVRVATHTLGGRVTVESTPDEGTQVRFRFPATTILAGESTLPRLAQERPEPVATPSAVTPASA